jgi:Flp pilus assembly secretin CpaC
MEICDSGYAIMGNKSQKISRSRILLMAAVAVVLWVGGCIDPFNEQAASRQAEGIISNLGTVKTAPEPNIPMPEIYKSPPKVVEQVVAGKPEWKLFYFCKYHTSDELKKITNELFGMVIFNEKGQATTVPDYAVSSNPATNQLIVRCPARADIDAVLDVLQAVDVPPVQVKIDCIISEVYADKTLDRQTSVQIGKLLGEEGDIWAGPAGQKFGTDIATLLEEGDLLPAFPGASLRDIGRARMGLKIGYWSKKHNFIALVDLLESKGYLKILMNPTLEVVNGKPAMVSSSQHVPLQQVTSYIPARGEYLPESRIDYIDVVDSLKITPHVFADDYIGLETDILLGSKLTPEGVKQMPIITKKEIEIKENRIRQGESLVIGGIRKTERRDVVRGVPLLKDIPIIGLLFSGRDFEERVVETVFILTPTISTGGIPRTEMVEEVKRKHEPPTPQSAIDPFGLDSRKKELQNKTQEAEEARLQANAEKAGARGAIRAAQERVQIAEAASQKARTELTRIQAEAEKIKTEAEVKTKAAEAAKTTADKATADAAAAKTAAEKIAADATKTKEESEKAKAEADAKAKAAEAAKAAADKAAAEAATAKAEAEKIAAQALKTKAEAEKIIADAEAEAVAAAKEEADQPKEEPGKTPTEENKAGT